MKIPSFVRVPKYRRFNFEPRHYDPIKEELKNRTELIQQQINNVNSDYSVKHRISEAFVRDKHRTGGKVNGLQLALVFLLSATFVGFLYIGFYAFFITGVIILIYVLFQLGVFKRKEPPVNTIAVTQEEPTSAMRMAGQIREGHYFYRERSTGKGNWYKLLILLAAAGVALAYYVLQLNGIMCLLIIFILLILFVKESNKTR